MAKLYNSGSHTSGCLILIVETYANIIVSFRIISMKK